MVLNFKFQETRLTLELMAKVRALPPLPTVAPDTSF